MSASWALWREAPTAAGHGMTSRGVPVAESHIESNSFLLEKIEALERELSSARHLALHDALTGLPNRTLMLDRLEQAMQQAPRQRKAVGVLLIDLDGFKGVNDRLGHGVGDMVLQGVAARLRDCIRGCDTACRYGGDEFVILLPEIDRVEDAEVVVRKIRACLSAPHRLGGRLVAIQASIGVAHFREGETSCGELIGMADAAMYRAKAQRTAAARQRRSPPAGARSAAAGQPSSRLSTPSSSS